MPKSQRQRNQESESNELLDSLLADQAKAERDGVKKQILQNQKELMNQQRALIAKLFKQSSQHQVQQIIDFPRHMRFSSQYQSLQETQNLLRHQRIFHKEYEPRMHDKAQKKLYSSVYTPNNASLSKENEEMYVVEYFKQKKHLKNDKKSAHSGAIVRRSVAATLKKDPSDQESEQNKKELHYVFDLLKSRAELNNDEDEEAKEKVLPLDSNKKVLDMMSNKKNKALKGVARCFVAK